jgi:hypothetical protein
MICCLLASTFHNTLMCVSESHMAMVTIFYCVLCEVCGEAKEMVSSQAYNTT